MTPEPPPIATSHEHRQQLYTLHQIHKELVTQTAELRAVRMRSEKIHYWVPLIGNILLLILFLGGCEILSRSTGR